MERRIALEELDANLFRADPANLWTPPGARGIFGGQVIGQALAASPVMILQRTFVD